MSNKDWTGNKKSIWSALAANNHSEAIRESNDFYATDPKALELFLDKLNQDGIKFHNDIWECACGEGNLSKVLEKRRYNVISSDLIDRGYGKILDFFEINKLVTFDEWGNEERIEIINGPFKGDILTNPPYSKAKEFVEHALDILADGYYAVFFLKIQFLEGKSRKKLFEKYPPKYVYVHSERQKCAINNEFDKVKSSAVCYA